MLTSTGRRQEGLAAIRRAVEVDPQGPLWQLNQAALLFSLGREDDAIAMWQRLVKTSPDFTLTYQFLWDAFNTRAMFDQAFAAAKMFHAGRGDDEAAESLGRGYAEGGYQRAMRAVAEMMASRFTRRYVHPTAVARLYAYAGDRDKAIEWLEKAYEGRDSQLMYLAWHMEWDGLRADPRVQALLRRMKLPVR